MREEQFATDDEARCEHLRAEKRTTGRGTSYAACPDCPIAFPTVFAARVLADRRSPVAYDQEEQR